MIHVTSEGYYLKNGFNYVKISDGGFALVLKFGQTGIYFRRRGKFNRASPRHYMTLHSRDRMVTVF